MHPAADVELAGGVLQLIARCHEELIVCAVAVGRHVMWGCIPKRGGGETGGSGWLKLSEHPLPAIIPCRQHQSYHFSNILLGPQWDFAVLAVHVRSEQALVAEACIVVFANARLYHRPPHDRNSHRTPASDQNLRVHDSRVERVARDPIRGSPGELRVEHDVQQLGETVGGVATVPAFFELRHVFESEAR